MPKPTQADEYRWYKMPLAEVLARLNTPPTRADGYLWVCHTLARSEQVRQMVRDLPADARYHLIHNDIGPLNCPYDADVELWVHPDDIARVAPVMHAALTGS